MRCRDWIAGDACISKYYVKMSPERHGASCRTCYGRAIGGAAEQRGGLMYVPVESLFC